MEITYRKSDGIYDCYLTDQESEFHSKADISTTKAVFMQRMEEYFDSAMMICVEKQLSERR